MYENELKRILDASQNNALSFFVGAGVSALSNAPTWKALIDSICVKLGREKKDSYSSDEYLQIPQMLYYSLGENKSEYNRFVNEQLHSADLKPNDIHHEMLELNPVSFITTNYDTAEILIGSVRVIVRCRARKLTLGFALAVYKALIL